MTKAAEEFDNIMQQLKRARDEIELKIHLGTMEAKQEWEELEKKWSDFEARAEFGRTSEEVGKAASQLAEEIKNGYERLRKALT